MKKKKYLTVKQTIQAGNVKPQVIDLDDDSKKSSKKNFNRTLAIFYFYLYFFCEKRDDGVEAPVNSLDYNIYNHPSTFPVWSNPYSHFLRMNRETIIPTRDKM